jgi:hypothetical protein
MEWSMLLVAAVLAVGTVATAHALRGRPHAASTAVELDRRGTRSTAARAIEADRDGPDDPSETASPEQRRRG